MSDSLRNLLLAGTVVVIAIIAGVAITPSQSGVIVTVGGGFLAMLYRLMQQDTKVEENAEEVKEKLDVSDQKKIEKIDRLTDVADATHDLVNSRMTAQLRLTAVLARRLANLPGATDEDRKTADDADREYRDHDGKQTMVDANKPGEWVANKENGPS